MNELPNNIEEFMQRKLSSLSPSEHISVWVRFGGSTHDATVGIVNNWILTNIDWLPIKIESGTKIVIGNWIVYWLEGSHEDTENIRSAIRKKGTANVA